jgi:hypothetical protein
MRTTFAALAAILLGASLASAQGGSVPCPPIALCSEAECPPLFWIEADYLHWWLRPGPLATPLAVTGSVDDPAPGVLGQPNTRVLGPSKLDGGSAPGARLAIGAWLDDDRIFGVEANGFLLSQIGGVHTDASGPLGSPLLGRPIVQENGLPFTLLTAANATSTGFVRQSFTTVLGGMEANTLAAIGSDGLSVLAGFRYLRLAEDLTVLEGFRALADGVLPFGGQAVPEGTSLSTTDHFATRTTFYGGQVGARYEQSFGRLTLGVQGKLGVGFNDQVVRISGGSAANFPDGGRATLPGGVLALPSNGGQQRHTAFSLLPEVGVNIGYRVNSALTVRAGYQVMYWTNVVRPGNQIDPVVNLRQVPTLLDYGTAGGTARPAPVLRQSDFWAQGLNVGVVLSF